MKASVFCAVTIIWIALSACTHDPKIGKGIEPLPTTQETKNDPRDIRVDKSDDGKTTTILEDIAGLNPVFFDYDKADIRADQISVLQANAIYMHNTSARRIQIQGHCDERGTEEYNLALGDRRARAVKDYLTTLGISNERLSTISYGEAEPFQTEHNESAWSKNRRAQFLTEQQ